MDFDLTERQAHFRDRVRAFIDEHVRPRQKDYYKRNRHRRPLAADAGDRGAEAGRPRRRACGTCSCRRAMRSSHVDESFAFEGTQLTNLEYALCAEEMGRIAWSTRGVQLLGARHRQYGGAAPLRHARAEGAVAAAADERRDPLGLPDDRAGGRLVRRDQHRMRHRPRRRRLCDQRPQMVVVGRRRPALQGRDPDGQDRPEAPTSTASNR